MSEKLPLSEEMEWLKERIAELEMRESFHEDTLNTLNETIIEQQRMIDRLHNSMTLLAERLKEQSDRGEGEQYTPEQERPPHY